MKTRQFKPLLLLLCSPLLYTGCSSVPVTAPQPTSRVEIFPEGITPPPRKSPETAQIQQRRTPQAGQARMRVEERMEVEAIRVNGARISSDEDFDSNQYQDALHVYSNNAAHSRELKPRPAKIQSWQKSSSQANRVQLKVGDNTELPLKGLQIDVKVTGFRARVVIDSYYYNDQDQSFEGDFKFRLPDGASPFFFAFGQSQSEQKLSLDPPIFDTAESTLRLDPSQVITDKQWQNEAPKVARMAPRERAAFAYTQTVKRQIDPALLEWSGSGIYAAQVFPLTAKTMHRIVLGYDVDLLKTPQGYELNLPFSDLDIEKRLNVEVDGSATLVNSEYQTLDFDGVTDTRHGTLSRVNNNHITGLQIALQTSDNIALVNQNPEVGHLFAAELAPDIPQDKQSKSADKAIFMVDVSLSSAPEKFNIWLQLLSAILANNEDQMREFAVLFFNIDQFWWQDGFVVNNELNRSLLTEYLNTLALEGATDLGSAFKETANPRWHSTSNAARHNLFLLSDGAVTWGENNDHQLSGLFDNSNIDRLFAYRTGLAQSDTRLLQKLANQRNGGIFSVVSEAHINKASIAHRFSPWIIQSLQSPGTEDLLIQGRPSALYPGQPLRVVGKGRLTDNHPFTLTLQNNGRTINVEMPVAQVIDSSLTDRTFGQVATSQLEALPTLRKQATAFANYFKVPGKSSSLVMLESEAEYRNFNIDPTKDRQLISDTNVEAQIAQTLQKLRSRRPSQKAVFAALLQQLETSTIVQFTPTDAMNRLFKTMPESTFVMGKSQLTAKVHDKSLIDNDYLNHIHSTDINYDKVVAEAKLRNQVAGGSDALVAFSSLIEHSPTDSALLREAAYKALSWQLPGVSAELFKQLIERRTFEPTPYRDLANALAQAGYIDLAILYFEILQNTQWPSDSQSTDFDKIVAVDYIRHLARALRHNKINHAKNFAQTRLAELKNRYELVGADLIVQLAWNTDNSDVDLHVYEPSGEKCFYSHPKTASGGYITRDITTGFGPEMYVIQNAQSGTYEIEIEYFAQNANKASTKSQVTMTIIENLGEDNERVTHSQVALNSSKNLLVLGRVHRP